MLLAGTRDWRGGARKRECDIDSSQALLGIFATARGDHHILASINFVSSRGPVDLSKARNFRSKLVILSGVVAAHREATAESKEPYRFHGLLSSRGS